MTMAVIWDPVELAPRGEFDIVNGWTPERSAIVTGVTGMTEEELYNALETLVAAGDLPAVGSAHGRVVNATLSGYAVEARPPERMAVRMRYRQVVAAFSEETQQQQLTSPTLTYGFSLGAVQTNRDAAGTVIVVEHEGKQQSGLISRMVPQDSIAISRMEIGSPVDRIRPYRGKMNLAGWRVRPTDPAGTWLFVGVNAVSVDYGATYRVDYQFQYRDPDGPYSTWDEEVCYVDPETGRPPADVYESPGLVRVANYLRADFNGLGLA